MTVDLVEQGLAAIRLNRLIGVDKVTMPVRIRFFKRFPSSMSTSNGPVRPSGAGWQIIEGLADGEVSGWYHEGSPFGRWAADLLACPYWCLSVWSGLVVAVLVRCGPVGRVVVRALALSLVTAVGYDEAVPLSGRPVRKRA